MAIVPKAKREVSIDFVRNGQTAPSHVVPDAQGKFEMGDIGVQPVIHPEIVRSTRGNRPKKPACRAATSSWPPAASSSSRYDQLRR